MVDPRQAVFAIFDAYSPPDMWLGRGGGEGGLEHVAQPLRPLREDLVGMPVRCLHHPGHAANVILWHILMEQVAHGVDEDHLRRLPPQRLSEFPRHETK